ncbi:collagen alpha-1(III) chain-like [Mustela erminea]|uniref:collagen alpha-1(III) chain-like n=1 Tax=Mustela erminea TaxID=36723 RepID=UPI0013870B5A|nr:collagen alpha-1(III) chain-like [Mustela erminea]
MGARAAEAGAGAERLRAGEGPAGLKREEGRGGQGVRGPQPLCRVRPRRRVARGAVPCRGPRRPGPPESLDRDRLLPRGPGTVPGAPAAAESPAAGRGAEQGGTRTRGLDAAIPVGPAEDRAAGGPRRKGIRRWPPAVTPAGGRAGARRGRRCCGGRSLVPPGRGASAGPPRRSPGPEPLVSLEAPRVCAHRGLELRPRALPLGRRLASLAQLCRPECPGPSSSARPAAPPRPPPSPPLEVFLELERRMCLLSAPDSPRFVGLFPLVSHVRACSKLVSSPCPASDLSDFRGACRGGQRQGLCVPPPASRLRSKPVFFMNAQGQDLVLKTTLVTAVGK